MVFDRVQWKAFVIGVPTLECEQVTSKGAQTIISKLMAHCPRHGIPVTFVSDDDPQYACFALATFGKSRDITCEKQPIQQQSLGDNQVCSEDLQIKLITRKCSDVHIRSIKLISIESFTTFVRLHTLICIQVTTSVLKYLLSKWLKKIHKTSAALLEVPNFSWLATPKKCIRRGREEEDRCWGGHIWKKRHQEGTGGRQGLKDIWIIMSSFQAKVGLHKIMYIFEK